MPAFSRATQCSLRGIAAIVPDDQEKAFLFDARTDIWNDHFQWEGSLLSGLTFSGRATIALLQINELRPMVFSPFEGEDGKFWKVESSQGGRRLMTVPPYLARTSEELLSPTEVVEKDAER